MVEQNVLILEDDTSLSMQWARALKSEGYTAYVTHIATDAVQVFQDNNIDLCILDFEVREHGTPTPEGGLRFLRKLSAADKNNTKILGVSGSRPNDWAVDAKKLMLSFGAEEFLNKPFQDHELIRKVTRMLVSTST